MHAATRTKGWWGQVATLLYSPSSDTLTEVEVWGSRVKKSAPGKSPAGDVYCVEKIFVPVYPAEQTVVVCNGACKLNLCCCTNGRLLQPGKIQLKFITILLQLECSHLGGQHTLWLDCTIIVV